ncbi:MAG: glycoside hydrolase family 26 protein, partial [Lachnospiraceae bacterium]|nr:glycoside hydrolase family 26 protein [Lachnospiraceae bacterium]
YGVIAEVLNPLLGESEPNKPDNPDKAEDIIYENNFDEVTDLTAILDKADETGASLAELAAGNKAVKFSVKLPGEKDWENIFQAQFNLSEAYKNAITGKIVMSYDVYFPVDKMTEDFKSVKAQAVLKSGENWKWVSQRSWPEFKADDMQEDENVSGYKKIHVEINMNDFEADGKDYPFEQITPIKAVIPCLAGVNSAYEGDIYLDNLVVKAVNESGDLPPVEGDLALALDASAWKVTAGYQYTGQSEIRNENIGDKNFLVFNMDYSNDSTQGWSEAKFDYTHSESVATLQGYNAFKADIYYKPTDKTSGSFGIKLFSNSPDINKDATIPVGEPADIDGLEGYYKAEYVLNLKIPAGEFQNLTLGLVGKNTDYKGDIYLDNMRFTQIVEEDVYVDSTKTPVKGAGIQIVDAGRNIQTASGKKVAIAEEVALVDAKAGEPTKNLYAYLKAVGESDSVIFGHQNDTHHKAGSTGDGFSNSDTKDITGSIAGVIGIDALSLTGNEASTWDAPESERIAKVVEITKEAAAEGALVTLSAHMPNFDVIDKRVKAYEASDKNGTDSDSVGYWEVDGEKQYNFSGYTPGTLTGNVVARVMPGQDLNYLYTDYLDLIADYAKAVEGEGITILFRPLHENTGSWFWWGAALCDEQAYIALYRYTVDYLKETKGVHNLIYVYGPGSEAANVTEYGARYPGDDYVDMIGYDLYHQMPSPENEEGYLQSIRKQNAILKEFATVHNKLYAITETGVADKNAEGEDVALQRTGNKVMDWYKQLLNEISDDGVCYFLVWANFSENGSFYLPYVVEKKENGVLHGHEMMDEFIEFYNDNRSVFATDMNSEFKKISGVTNTTEAGAVSGYIIAPQSGERLLTGNGNTRMVAMISGDVGEEKVQFIASAGDKKVVLEAELNEQRNVWEALLSDEDLLSLGEIPGTIALNVGQKEIAVINARFNLKEPVQDDMVPEDFESYAGSNRELNSAWPTNKDSGSEIALTLTEEKDKVFGGKYGMQIDITLAKSDAWVGATKSFEADWSAGNALELYTIPETKGQKIVVQVKSGGEEFEVYLQKYEDYTKNAMTGTPVKVTIPFGAFVGKNNGKFDPSKIEVIGLWCNALPN